MSIRPACPGDMGCIARIARETWLSTYGSYVPADVQARLLDHFYSPDALRRSLARPETRFYVADWDGEPAGFAEFTLDGSGIAELSRLYVRPGHQRRGIGSALLSRGEVDLSPEARVLRLAVIAGNEGACSFYGSRGFTYCGSSEMPAPGFTFHLDWYEKVLRRES